MEMRSFWITSVAIGVFAAASTLADTSGLEDPTEPPDSPPAVEDAEETPTIGLKSIIKVGGERVAVIDGTRVRVGDSIGGREDIQHALLTFERGNEIPVHLKDWLDSVRHSSGRSLLDAINGLKQLYFAH